MAIVITYQGKRHLVEVLGEGRQYLIMGDHPNGHRYAWDTPLEDMDADTDLTWIEKDDVERFLARVTELMEMLPGVEVQRVGTGDVQRDRATVQSDLHAPSITALRECVLHIPNDDDLFPGREDYIKIGYAIKAAAGESISDGYDVFAEWAGRHDADERVTGDPETWANDWAKMTPPFSVGWTWLAEIAKPFGFESAVWEFDADGGVEPVEEDDTPPVFSDVWLAERVIEEWGDSMRYVPSSGQWYVWAGGRWKPDAVLLADHYIGRTLSRQAAILLRQGGTVRERAKAVTRAEAMCSARRLRDVRLVVRSDPRMTAMPDVFDNDPWLLNTPAGVVELRSGDILDHDANLLCSRQTTVAPDFEMAAPRWERFLIEATGGDVLLQDYLQRLAGYALTGMTTEQMFAFVWGTGGNGKGTFLTALTGVLGDYHMQATMDTFVALHGHQHPTDLAGLVGARLVTAVEVESGHRWNEQRLKSLTGGDQIRARFMRQDFFTYTPQFTLVIVGNHKPEIRNIDDAIRRRVHLVPFTTQPEVRDLDLSEKLRAEYPAILAWMIAGCVRWQSEGLLPPPTVIEATEEYFLDEDPVQRWLDDACVMDIEAVTPSTDLYRSWVEWSHYREEFTGNMRRFVQLLSSKPNVWRIRHRQQRSFKGVRVLERSLEGLL